MNKVQLIGHVGDKPEIRTMQSGGKVASFPLATSERWKDKKTGEKKERTEWHRVVIFNPGLVKIAEKYIQKGGQLFVEGAVETRKWQDAEKKDRYTTEIVLRPFNSNLYLLGKKQDVPADAEGELPEDDHPENDSQG